VCCMRCNYAKVIKARLYLRKQRLAAGFWVTHSKRRWENNQKTVTHLVNMLWLPCDCLVIALWLLLLLLIWCDEVGG
jgi:hypothetical protein